MRNLIALVVVTACRKDAPVADRAQPVAPEAAPAATPVDASRDPAGAAGHAAVDAAAVAPVGDAKLVPVPAELASKVALVEVARGLARPVAIVAAPGDTRKRLFVVEQFTGRIRVVENGKLAPKPFFTIDRKLSKGNEQGLLGLAFHPQFATNGKLYINYTAEDKDTHIVEYKVSADRESVDLTSRRELVEIAQPYSNHNGGDLAFGPDGKLYTGMGDGGSAGDPERNGQDPKALLAKILRFDVDAPKPQAEIVHMGVRNPWRFSFDAKDGALYIGDVGQNQWEYVFVVANDGKKHNFGWNIVEGNHCYDAKKCDRSGFTPPVVDYPHAQGCSITGGFVYRGKALPALAGRYFYADYCTGLLRSFVWTAPSVVREHWDWKKAIDRENLLSQVSSFGVDHDGELYVVLLTGTIYKLAPRGV